MKEKVYQEAKLTMKHMIYATEEREMRIKDQRFPAEEFSVLTGFLLPPTFPVSSLFLNLPEKEREA